MGLFGKGSNSKPTTSNGYEKSGSAGKPGQGYGKGSANSNPSKHTPRTEAQAERQSRSVDKFKD